MRVTERQLRILTMAREGKGASKPRTHAAAAPSLPLADPKNAIHLMGLSKLKPEQQVQIGLMRWFQATHPELFPLVMASAGGLWTSIKQATRMKSMGYKKGTPDIFFAYPMGGKHGLFLELKAANGKPSPEQKQMIQSLQEQGYAAAIAVGFDQAIALVTAYLKQN